MRILIDIGHPGHVHLFRSFAREMTEKGHAVLFTCREKEFEKELLEAAGFQYISFGRKFTGLAGKVYGLFKFGYQELKAGVTFKPDIFLSHGSPYAAHASWLMGKPHISFEDTFNFEQVRIYKPFTDTILTGDYEHPLKSCKVVKYSGYHELAYLHPKRFTPNKIILDVLGVKPGEKYVILRFISWQATHDIGHAGISFENKLKTVREFEKYARVFISSEKELQPELNKYKINIKPEWMHDAIAFSCLLFGESATMASEAAMLGVPAIFLDNTGRYYTSELQHKYQLCFNYSESEEDQNRAINRGIELLKTDGLKEEWGKRRRKLLNDKIDVTDFLMWFVENWPDSKLVARENPDFRKHFLQIMEN
jgi:uncharacterized protein